MYCGIDAENVNWSSSQSFWRTHVHDDFPRREFFAKQKRLKYEISISSSTFLQRHVTQIVVIWLPWRRCRSFSFDAVCHSAVTIHYPGQILYLISSSKVICARCDWCKRNWRCHSLDDIPCIAYSVLVHEFFRWKSAGIGHFYLPKYAHVLMALKDSEKGPWIKRRHTAWPWKELGSWSSLLYLPDQVAQILDPPVH